MEWVIAAATILGGIAALLYFWERITSWFKGAKASDTANEDKLNEKWVDINYPRDSGLQTRLEGEGFQVRWCREDKLARRLDIDGWDLALEEADKAVRSVLKLADRPRNQVLIKKRAQ